MDRQPPASARRAGVSAFGFGGTNFHARARGVRGRATTTVLTADLAPRPRSCSPGARRAARRLRAEASQALRRALERVRDRPRLDARPGRFHDERAAARRAGPRRVFAARSCATAVAGSRSPRSTRRSRPGGDGTQTHDRIGLYLSDEPPARPSQVAASSFPARARSTSACSQDLAAGAALRRGAVRAKRIAMLSDLASRAALELDLPAARAHEGRRTRRSAERTEGHAHRAAGPGRRRPVRARGAAALRPAARALPRATATASTSRWPLRARSARPMTAATVRDPRAGRARGGGKEPRRHGRGGGRRRRRRATALLEAAGIDAHVANLERASADDHRRLAREVIDAAIGRPAAKGLACAAWR